MTFAIAMKVVLLNGATANKSPTHTVTTHALCAVLSVSDKNESIEVMSFIDNANFSDWYLTLTFR